MDYNGWSRSEKSSPTKRIMAFLLGSPRQSKPIPRNRAILEKVNKNLCQNTKYKPVAQVLKLHQYKPDARVLMLH